MDRVHYRRVRPSRINGEHIKPINDELTTGETVILQSIVCGVLVIIVLLISILNIAPTAALRDGLRQMLSGAETPAEFITEVRYLGEEYLGWGVGETNITPAAENEAINPQIPVPSAVPGLWE